MSICFFCCFFLLPPHVLCLSLLLLLCLCVVLLSAFTLCARPRRCMCLVFCRLSALLFRTYRTTRLPPTSGESACCDYSAFALSICFLLTHFCRSLQAPAARQAPAGRG